MKAVLIVLIALVAIAGPLPAQNAKAQGKRCQEMIPMYKQGVKKAIEDYVRKAINKNAKVTLVDGICKDWNNVDIMAFVKNGKSEYVIAGKAQVVGALQPYPQNWKVTGLDHAKIK
ncbi:MAG: hypothetical protein IPG73_01830 [Ignavibacteria bacterium]|nr:hypothetical protein [Ignavibacteria bacterium]